MLGSARTGRARQSKTRYVSCILTLKSVYAMMYLSLARHAVFVLHEHRTHHLIEPLTLRGEATHDRMVRFVFTARGAARIGLDRPGSSWIGAALRGKAESGSAGRGAARQREAQRCQALLG